MAVVACPHCGVSNVDESAFCASCGKALPSSAPTGPRVITGNELPQSAVGRDLRSEQLKKTMRKATGALLAVAIIQTIMGPVMLWLQKTQMESQNPGMTYQIQPLAYAIVWGLAGVFFVLYIWARSNPFPAAIVGLILFVSVIALDAVFDPSTLIKGWIMKIIVIVVLSQAISAGSQYKRLLEQGPAQP